jgi:hypothetical protein
VYYFRSYTCNWNIHEYIALILSADISFGNHMQSEWDCNGRYIGHIRVTGIYTNILPLFCQLIFHLAVICSLNETVMAWRVSHFMARSQNVLTASRTFCTNSRYTVSIWRTQNCMLRISWPEREDGQNAWMASWCLLCSVHDLEWLNQGRYAPVTWHARRDEKRRRF